MPRTNEIGCTPPKPLQNGPQRTCAGCRKTDGQAALLRAVADAAGRLRFDNGRWRSPGRGCYVHRVEACVQAALRGGFARSLRRNLHLHEHEIRAMLADGRREDMTHAQTGSLAARGLSNRDDS